MKDFSGFEFLENERVRLDILSEKHHAELLSVTEGHPDLLKYSPPENHTSEKMQLYIKNHLVDYEAGTRLPLVIYDKKYEVIAGSTSFLNISIKNSRAEIGSTWIGKQFQGTNLNTHMKYLMLRYGFEEVQLERIELKSDALNQQSRRAMEKLGAIYEGLLRSHTLLSDGRRRDSVYYSILKDEWQDVKQKLENKL